MGFFARDTKTKSGFRYFELCMRTLANQALPAHTVVCGFDACLEESFKDGDGDGDSDSGGSVDWEE